MVSSLRQLSVPFSAYVALFAAFLIFLHHVRENSCRFFGLLFFLSLFSSCFSFFLYGLACFVVFRARYASISLALSRLIAVVLVFSVSQSYHRMCISLGSRISTDTGCTDDVVG